MLCKSHGSWTLIKKNSNIQKQKTALHKAPGLLVVRFIVVVNWRPFCELIISSTNPSFLSFQTIYLIYWLYPRVLSLWSWRSNCKALGWSCLSTGWRKVSYAPKVSSSKVSLSRSYQFGPCKGKPKSVSESFTNSQ